MASWQARAFAACIRAFVRRDDWGEPRTLARRSRRVFGPPRIWQWVVSRGVHIEPVSDPVRGEWVHPPNRQTDAVILYVHGGGFVSCSAATHRPITIWLARRTGARVFNVDYRLAPEHPFPAAIDDVYSAYRWLADQAGIVAVAGDSAGGGLALSLATRVRDANFAAPASVVCFSPWVDLAGTGESRYTNAERDAMFAPNNVDQFARAALGGASPSNPLASPFYADLSGLSPLYLEVGADEQLLDDARRVHGKVIASGGDSTLHIVEGVFHAWQLCAHLMPEANQSLDAASEFITTHFMNAHAAIEATR
jgi:acetyl esterase/lipase